MNKQTRAITRLLAMVFMAAAVTRADLATVIMPGADLVLTLDFSKMRQAPIAKKFEELEALKKELGQTDNMDKMTSFDDKLTQLTGLKEEDFLTLTAAVEMDAVDLDSGEKPNFVEMDAVLGVRLAKVLTDDQLEKGLKAFAEQMAEEEDLEAVPVVSRTQHNGVTVFKTQKAGETDALFFAITDSGKALFMGSEMGITGALSRQGKGEKTPTTGLFPPSIAAAVKNADFALMFQPTAAMRAKMKETAANPESGPNAMFEQVFSQMKGLGLAITSTDVMNVQLIGDFGDKAVAEQTRGLLDTQVISMVKMFASMAAGGKPVPLLQTLAAGAAENGTATVTLTITGEDIDVFKEIMKEQAEWRNDTPVDGEFVPVE
ncbi:MAG: hypothetical protein RRC34_06485 [Lentisphaeria bacterium]|nr:hypothetical protein [Lentisphaeria bacterium]